MTAARHQAVLPSETRPDELAGLTALPREFYERDPREVARELIGKLLVRRLPHATRSSDSILLAGRIVETEAYLGSDDPAAHAYRGPTARNAVLFGPPGHAYVYFIYGNHYCTNVSCQPEGEAGCVLLRALEPVCGLERMAALRGISLGHASADEQPALSQLRRLTSGPGRLSQALAIDRAGLNGCDLCSASGRLFIAEAGDAWRTKPETLAGAQPRRPGKATSRVLTTPRINVPRAPRPRWRYILAASPFISRVERAASKPAPRRKR